MRVDSDERLWDGWPGAAGPGCARAFGQRVEDLDVDFAGLSRPELVSVVLMRCLISRQGALSNDEVWSWTLGQRLQALLAIALASRVPPLTLLQSCRSCAERFEVNIDANVFERQERDSDFEWSPQPGTTLRIVLPTGLAQRAWSGMRDVALHVMARALVTTIDDAAPSADWKIPEEWIDPLAQELERRDPLTALEVETACPACAAPNEIEVDLEAELLARLQACQRQTLSEIHRLATAYHWSEAAILQMPAWRRRHYLAQLGEGHA